MIARRLFMLWFEKVHGKCARDGTAALLWVLQPMWVKSSPVGFQYKNSEHEKREGKIDEV